MYEHILIGCDPEVFIRNPNDQSFVTAHNLIPGTKQAPHFVDNGAVQVDGCALEFNTNPASTGEEFVFNVRSVYEQLVAMVPGYNVVSDPVAEFDPTYFKDFVPKEAKELGCEPDFNGWTSHPNKRPLGDRPFRTAAGHIHIGWDKDLEPFDAAHYALCCRMAKQLDYYIGVNTLLWDPDNRRRSMYGLAGSFRPKPYGLEYRVPSNAWLKSPLLMRWIYDASVRAVRDYGAGKILEDKYGDAARTIIDNNLTNWREDFQFDTGLPTPPTATFKRAA